MLGEFQTLVNPGVPIPPFISVLTGITDAMVAGAPRLGAALPAFLEFAGATRVLVAHNAPFDVGFLKAACAATGHAWPRHRVLDTARLARQVAHPRRGAQLQAGHPGPALPGRHDARPPGAGRRPGHRRRAARPARAARQPRRPLARRAVARSPRGSRPPSARKRHLAEAPAAPPRASTCSSTSAARSLYVGKSKRPAHPGAQLLHRRRDPRPDGRDGRAGRPGRRRSCARTPLEAEVRELRLIAAAQAALQPAVAVPRAGAVAQAHRRGRSRGCPWSARSATTARTYLGPFSGAAAGRAGDGGACTRRSRCASAPPRLSPRRRHAAPARWPRWAAAARRATAARPSRPYAAHAAAVRAAMLGDVRPVVAALSRKVTPAGRGRALRGGGACTATGWPPSSAPPPGCSGCPRSPAAPSWSPPGQRDDGGWEIVVVRHGRLAAHGGRRPRPTTRGRRRRRPGRHRRDRCRPGTGPTPARHAPRRPSASCAGSSSPAPGWSRSTGTWACPAYGAGGVRLWADAAEARPRRARPVRRPARHPAGAPARRRGQPDRLTTPSIRRCLVQ